METRVSPSRKRFSQLTLAEREIIRRMLSQKRRVREIATVLGKDRSTIFRELKRNKNAGNQYYEDQAQSFLRKHASIRFRTPTFETFLTSESRMV